MLVEVKALRAHTRQSVPCLNTFDPRSSACFTSVSTSLVLCPSTAHFVGRGTVGGGGLRHGMDAHAHIPKSHKTKSVYDSVYHSFIFVNDSAFYFLFFYLLT